MTQTAGVHVGQREATLQTKRFRKGAVIKKIKKNLEHKRIYMHLMSRSADGVASTTSH